MDVVAAYELTFFLNWNSGMWCPIGCPLVIAATNRPIVPAPSNYDDGEIGGMMVWQAKPKYSEKNPAPVPLCPPQTSHAARTRTRAAAVGNPSFISQFNEPIGYNSTF
jgi:hypothetical protein